MSKFYYVEHKVFDSGEVVTCAGEVEAQQKPDDVSKKGELYDYHCRCFDSESEVKNYLMHLFNTLLDPLCQKTARQIGTARIDKEWPRQTIAKMLRSTRCLRPYCNYVDPPRIEALLAVEKLLSYVVLQKGMREYSINYWRKGRNDE
jgi:hypothetical protein